ncbi:hypothetical protein evm_006948 [Chilo suppressalis]|nr:hypothetical protein evm_006948 [Chilo suppressalis]
MLHQINNVETKGHKVLPIFIRINNMVSQRLQRNVFKNLWPERLHHQPINAPTAGAQAFLIDGIGRLGHDPPRGPSADWLQRRAVRIIGDEEVTKKLESLQLRRDVASLSAFYRLYHGECSEELLSLIPPSPFLQRTTRAGLLWPLFLHEQRNLVTRFFVVLFKMGVLHVIVKAGPSPRPLAWSLEVSSSEHGEDWRMVRAFGDRDHCKKLWDLRPERRRRKVRAARRTSRADKPTCSTQFVSPKPLESGEMHVGLGDGVSARRVRISFRAAHPTVSRQQYYTVRALTIAARCLCHGHARHCNVDHQGAKCDCQHGTCGNHCQRCCSGDRWQPHKPCEGAEDRQECSCGERGACTYDDTGAILCVNCTENRAGPLCDRCLSGYYSILPDGPCLPCDCDPEGSDGSCKWDRRQRHTLCACYPGFAGRACDACEDRASTFPACLTPDLTPATVYPATTVTSCKCDPRGIVDPARACDEVCECKANVVGERCDACAPGFFGLSAQSRGGCTPCYCSHVAHSCLTADHDQAPAHMMLPMGAAWMVTDSMGNETVEPSFDEDGKPFLTSYEVEGWEAYYWVSHTWSGQQLDAYGRQLEAQLTWGLQRGDTGGSPLPAPDLLLLGNDGTKLAFGNSSHEQPGLLELSAPLLEDHWFSLEDPVVPVTRTQLMDVLADLKAVMIRAHYHYDQDEVRLESVSLGERVDGVQMERCSCAAGYEGQHCQRCAWTHARVARQCLPCACHGHATCVTVDGPCGECQHNTTGPHCERCLPGHYGNPVQGGCKPCACPLYLLSNNFSPNCALASAEGDEFVCTQCPDGYTGDHCENCDFGYWGSPSTPGGRCEPCGCNGSPCHPRTGACRACPPHAEGARCDQCEEGYWFGDNTSTVIEGGGVQCVECACGDGALAAACDARTGHCACRAGWTGRACDVCEEGHGGIAAGCPLCHCGVAAQSSACDSVTGHCACAPGAAPPSCDACLDEHYGLNATGCLGCNCSKLGAESNACDIRSGQCRCRPHVIGRACDTCEEGYWGLHRGGCRRCECGAGAAACDPLTGACACAAGVGGAQCDTCLPGYYGFGPTGCLPCPKCTDGKICSPESGRCVCPPRARGPGCKHCAPGYHYGPGGCSPCHCGPGAVTNQCDPQTGQCKCKAGWVGVECERCAPGHFGPRCRPCLCDAAGTRDCEEGVCSCDDEGRCPCKENVVGDKCSECLSGTFGLSAANPSGCTACFCFGRAAHCTQAALTRAALHAARAHHVTVIPAARNVSVDEDSLIAIPIERVDSTIAVPYPPIPVYVELDKRFLGDRVTSYGGSLRFTVEEEGGEEMPPQRLASFPLVRLEGNGIELNHYQRRLGNNGTHTVRFHESLWELGGLAGAGRRAGPGRAGLMAALQRVDRLLLRLTTRAPLARDHVHALLLNVSLDTAIPGLSRSAPALGVEMCECSSAYSAPSCQLPAPGFWMPPVAVRFSNVAGTIVIHMEGTARPCDCNGRATACDPNTGACLNCTENTGGPRCSECAAGHYGRPGAGGTGGCQPCPCPSRAANYANACTLHAGRLQCLCKPGEWKLRSVSLSRDLSRSDARGVPICELVCDPHTDHCSPDAARLGALRLYSVELCWGSHTDSLQSTGAADSARPAL